MVGFGPHNPVPAAPKSPLMGPPITPSFFSVELDAPSFPAALRQLSRPPMSLWTAGRLPRNDERLVAIVGARAASLAGCALAGRLAAAAVGAGYGVVSGGALGIDAAAHRGALTAGGATFAVLGCGIDVVYPDRHGPLFGEISRGGGLVSEYPPGTPPRAGQFPVRNRLVAALAEATIGVEARPASGALITARLARALGRRVLAVPGSAGCDELVATGAALALEGADALVERLAGVEAPPPEVPAALAPLVRALRAGAAAPIDLALRMGATLPEVLAGLAEAELSGWARRLPGGRFEVLRAN
ncbi:MAG TPA: DNA-processing protein DprA [Polyangia bacterium]|nr:DNA-processing protein DprA [Polyangia bacterium]